MESFYKLQVNILEEVVVLNVLIDIHIQHTSLLKKRIKFIIINMIIQTLYILKQKMNL